MQCQSCKFDVEPKMKFALQTNKCPSCGEPLHSEEESKDIILLQQRIISKGILPQFDESESLQKTLAFDIAMFVMTELKEGLGLKYFQMMFRNLKDRDPQDEIDYQEELEKAQILASMEREILADAAPERPTRRDVNVSRPQKKRPMEESYDVSEVENDLTQEEKDAERMTRLLQQKAARTKSEGYMPTAREPRSAGPRSGPMVNRRG